VAVQDGIGLSFSSGNTINVTDGGIVEDAFNFAGTSFDNALLFAGNTVNNAFEFGAGTVNRALDSVDFATASSNNVVNNALEANAATTEAAIRASQESARNSLTFADSQIGRALETVDATLGEGFGRLMDISENLFSAGGKLIDQTQQTVATAYMDAANTAKGTIDNRTMIVLGVAAAATFAAVVYFRSKRG
jgi:hypothetical protein